MRKTLYDKLWYSHVVHQDADGNCLLYIDRHLINEVTSPQAFEGLRSSGRKPWRARSIIATADHNTPTIPIKLIPDNLARQQVDVLHNNIKESGALAYFPYMHPEQGIVHVVAPEMGATHPGMTIVCGDSHTSTHGAFGALAFGIGTSDVEHVLATQTLLMRKSKNFGIQIDGDLPPGTFAKDLALTIIGLIGASGAIEHVLEYHGTTIAQLTMEQRMTLCNMSIEAGARAGLVGVDDVTINYLKGRRFSPSPRFESRAESHWRSLRTDDDALYDRCLSIDASTVSPVVTWGTSPDMVTKIDSSVPDPGAEADPMKRQSMIRALKYMNLTPGLKMTDVVIDKVFIGSCTNARLEDLRVVAQLVQGRTVSRNIKQALIVPGSGSVKRQAESEGLHEIFLSAGFEWRAPGCSMCLGMNEDRLNPGERCASTSNRNFEGRQGMGGRSHLMSPAMAALAALKGRLTDIRDFV